MSNKRTFIVVTLLSILIGCATAPSTQGNLNKQEADSVLATNVRVKLGESKQLNATEIQVKADEGVVLLEGFVDTPEQKQAAQAITEQINGVREVDNEIIVK